MSFILSSYLIDELISRTLAFLDYVIVYDKIVKLAQNKSVAVTS